MNSRLLVPMLLWMLCPAWALSPEQMLNLHERDRLQWMDEQNQPVVMQITRINTFVEKGDLRWFRVTGRLADGSQATWLLDPSGNGDADLVTANHALRQTGLNRKDIWQIDESGKGSLVFDGVRYDYQADDSDDADYIGAPGETPRPISYYSFVSQSDDDVGFVVIEWGERQFELLETEYHDPADIEWLPPTP